MERTSVRLKRAVLIGAVLSLGAGIGRAQSSYGIDVMMESAIPGEPTPTRSARWKWNGKAEFSRPGDVDFETAWREHVQVEAALKSTAGERSGGQDLMLVEAGRRWLAVNLQSGDEYEIELPVSFLRQVARRAKAAGWDWGLRGTQSSEARRPFRPIGWRRQPRGRARKAGRMERRRRHAHAPVRQHRVSLSSHGADRRRNAFGCSGTLVGRRHVLTAAHCLWNVNTNTWSTATGFRFRPGREGTCNNASCEPYGEYTAIWFFTPVEFRETESFTYDYGIAVTSGFPGNLTGWLGYVGISQDLTNDYCDMVPFGPGYLGGSCTSRGYPACRFVENASLSGNNCQQGWAYQDVSPCEVGSSSNTGPDGWSSIFKTNCDLGRGHSGSAVFINNYNGNGKVVIGVASFQNCATCTDGNDYPNGIRRVTPDVLDWISYFKTVKFP